MTAATAMTISKRVARIGEIALFDNNIFFKNDFTSLFNHLSLREYLTSMKLQYRFELTQLSAIAELHLHAVYQLDICCRGKRQRARNKPANA